MPTWVRRTATLAEALLVALALPVAILVVGAPIALLVRLLLEMFRAL
jgi:hypothetical protein